MRCTTLLFAALVFPVSPLGAQTTFTVNSTDDLDDGTCDTSHCSLREAINAANANPGADVIEFNISGPGPHTIQPGFALPSISDPVVIDGTTEPDFAGTPIIELDGSNAGGVHGLEIIAGSSTVRGLVINRFGLNGVLISGAGATGNLIEGNFIGTDVNGAFALSNSGGVSIDNAPNNTIGGTTAGARNVISGNIDNGVGIGGSGATGNLVQGNFIGTNSTGTAALGNGNVGVLVANVGNAANNTIGGTTAAERNVISGNLEGVTIVDDGPGAGGNLVQGNYIGTDVTGTSGIGNVAGVLLLASANTIGGTSAGAGNTIAFNNGPGVNHSSGTGNAILSNSIFSNAELGIDLGAADGVTANDAGDGDTGANNLQNFPVVTSAIRGSTTIEGTVNSAPNTQFRLEFFANRTCDPSGHGEGETFLGSTMVTTDDVGNASFTVTFASTVSDPYITATATDPNNNTSEFSQCVAVLTPDFTVAVSPTSVTVTPGSAATYTVTISPSASFDNAVSLTCSDLPTLTSCSFVPASVTPGASDATSTLTVTTTAPSLGQVGAIPVYPTWPEWLWLGLAGLALATVVLAALASRKRPLSLHLAFAVALLVVTLHAACGGDGVTAPEPTGGTPTGTFTITITGTSGSLEHATTATLTVR